MDEAVVAQIDGHVVDTAALELEENQVAGPEVLAIDLLTVTAGHRVGRARKVEGGIVEGVFHQAAAIETFAWAAAAPTVRCSQYVHGTAQDVAARLGGHDRNQRAIDAAQTLSVSLVLADRKSVGEGKRGSVRVN